ncbi:helix-turn-helix transcriptional regulator [Sphingomonas sp. CGMCC 1.13654]|uniref:Helix-turn-helix transcriptional regulator n=1 Tax=Sphingomonas chungangi TaxID=2683589 RepID=A0A838L8E0_9SPHN|nr:helix-turn-helix domain-containing protein [Sphingomonas chungangi]MBA2933798.1 helix-turn-helix transcriptional regulator [Sphingomonas chungangi]MVW55128.1 TetR family transcriptional regulator [Sphingomonas chungangi]
MPRPTKPIISRQNASAAALDTIEQDGLANFGLGRVAQRLGVRAPSLYHHFESKDELLSEVSRLLLIEGTLPKIKEGLDWREEIVRISTASWRSVLRHPHAAPLLLQFFPRTLLMGAYEHWMHVLDVCGVPARWHITILEGSEKFTYGSALFAASARARGVPPYGEINAERYPYIFAAVEAHPFDEEETFVQALRAFLNGMPIES